MTSADSTDAPPGPAAVAAVEVRDLSVVYEGHHALLDVSFALPREETVAVIGPSGSGKTTLLRAIAGLEPVATGTVTIHGVDRSGTPPHERRVGLMFQDHALFPHLDVAANVGFGLKMQRRPAASIEQRTAEVLDLVGMGDFGHRRIETLSGGEAQRVALARALAPSPEVLMLDEPLGSLDRALRAELVGELRNLFTELGLAVIHVTHDQEEAFALADNVLVLRAGAVEQIGSPAEIWRRPASVAVASFLGHQNIWPTAGGAVLAPLPSLSIIEVGTDAGPEQETGIDQTGAGMVVDVVISDVEFREGLYRVTAVESSPADGRPRRFVVDTDRDPSDGSAGRARVVVDPAALVNLDH